STMPVRALTTARSASASGGRPNSLRSMYRRAAPVTTAVTLILAPWAPSCIPRSRLLPATWPAIRARRAIPLQSIMRHPSWDRSRRATHQAAASRSGCRAEPRASAYLGDGRFPRRATRRLGLHGAGQRWQHASDGVLLGDAGHYLLAVLHRWRAGHRVCDGRL